MTQKATSEQIISAYRETGSIWAAAKRLGMAGQTVHERLRRLDIPLVGQKWTVAEIEELSTLVGECTIAEIAHRLGRPYAGVACKISELGIGTRTGNRRQVKIPRGAGYDKASITRHIKLIDKTDAKITRYARANGLGIEALAQAIERYYPEWWIGYRRRHSDLPERLCPYCGRAFIPSTGKQTYCTRDCANKQRTDASYFGGKRRQTIGLAEGRCQICGREPKKGLSSHHMLGKENDPDNDYLIAICSGCHSLVTQLGARTWTTEQWEALISLAVVRREGAAVASTPTTVHVSVDIDICDDPAEDDELAALIAEPGQPTGATITIDAAP